MIINLPAFLGWTARALPNSIYCYVLPTFSDSLENPIISKVFNC